MSAAKPFCVWGGGVGVIPHNSKDNLKEKLLKYDTCIFLHKHTHKKKTFSTIT